MAAFACGASVGGEVAPGDYAAAKYTHFIKLPSKTTKGFLSAK